MAHFLGAGFVEDREPLFPGSFCLGLYGLIAHAWGFRFCVFCRHLEFLFRSFVTTPCVEFSVLVTALFLVAIISYFQPMLHFIIDVCRRLKRDTVRDAVLLREAASIN